MNPKSSTTSVATQPPQPNSHSSPAKIASATANVSQDDLKYEQKYVETKKEIESLEKQTETLLLSLSRSRKSLERLKFERKLLLDKLESLDPEALKSVSLAGLGSTSGGVGRVLSSILSLSGLTGDELVHMDEHQLLAVGAHASYSSNIANGEAADETGDDDTSIEKPEQHKRKRAKKKDPNAPKKPLNSYMQFCQDVRDDLKQQNPDISRADLTKLLSTNWKELAEDDKKKYHDSYEKDKERYAAEMSEYAATTGTAEVEGAAESVPPAGTVLEMSVELPAAPNTDIEEDEDDSTMADI